MSLFQRGEFTLHSGAKSLFKIDADYLTDGDIETLAWMIQDNMRLNFGFVEGVPTGGLRLAEAMKEYAQPGESDRLLIADDVWSTGASMREQRAGRYNTVGVVLFARHPVESWVFPLFKLGW